MYRVIKNQERIISFLIDYAEIANPDAIIRGKRRYNLSDGKCRRVFFITEGDFLLKLKDENKIINILSAPFVVGATPALDAPPLYLEKIDYGKVYRIDYGQFWRLVSDNRLLDDVLSILSGQYSDLMNYIMLSKSNSHDQVISLLERWSKIPSHLKKRFSVLYLLENSSYLSKSSISRVLKELKDKGELILEKGRFSSQEDITRQ
ncbi:transcriptional regulator [Enterobacteriaceae bacterium C23F]